MALAKPGILLYARLVGSIEMVAFPLVGVTAGVAIPHVEGQIADRLIHSDVVPRRTQVNG